MMTASPGVLEDKAILLRPLKIDDIVALRAAAADGELWTISTTTIPRPEEAESYVKRALELRAAGSALPFAIIVKERNQLVGTTRYMNIDTAHHRLEIGSTWLASSWQRTFVNSRAKYLLLQHAFDELGCNAVEFRTDILNSQSRVAIERLGARLDGVLRAHMIMRDGRVRDTVVYSIIKAEWHGIRISLQHRISNA